MCVAAIKWNHEFILITEVPYNLLVAAATSSRAMISIILGTETIDAKLLNRYLYLLVWLHEMELYMILITLGTEG